LNDKLKNLSFILNHEGLIFQLLNWQRFLFFIWFTSKPFLFNKSMVEMFLENAITRPLFHHSTFDDCCCVLHFDCTLGCTLYTQDQ